MRTQWPNNRIGYYEDHAFRQDRFGNRVQQLGLVEDEQELCPGQDLCYDGAHQLVAVELQAIRGHDIYLCGEGRYIYDALGRRLKKIVTTRDGQEDAWYFGWDGDRHVHTEHLREDGDRDITHVVYEPGSFTPLLHLSTTAKGAQAPKHLFVQAHELAVPANKRNDPSTMQALAMMESMMAGMPEALRKMHEDNMRHLIENGVPPQMQAIMGEAGQHTNKLLGTIRQRLKEAKQPTAPIVIRFFECGLVGTPIALINQAGGIDWAAISDPWGNIQQEYNPQGIEQNIRLPGQYHDRETDLYYNYRRYYDPKIGAYINQDPIGLASGLNTYAYVEGNPINYIDPEGLQPNSTALRPWNNMIEGSGAGAYVPLGVAAATAATAVANLPVSQPKSTPLACPDSNPKNCPPCKTMSGKIVTVGTIGYRLDLVPPSRPHHPYSGDHYNLPESVTSRVKRLHPTGEASYFS